MFSFSHAEVCVFLLISFRWRWKRFPRLVYFYSFRWTSNYDDDGRPALARNLWCEMVQSKKWLCPPRTKRLPISESPAGGRESIHKVFKHEKNITQIIFFKWKYTVVAKKKYKKNFHSIQSGYLIFKSWNVSSLTFTGKTPKMTSSTVPETCCRRSFFQSYFFVVEFSPHLIWFDSFLFYVCACILSWFFRVEKLE